MDQGSPIGKTPPHSKTLTMFSNKMTHNESEDHLLLISKSRKI